MTCRARTPADRSLSFHDYVLSRRYHFGRNSRKGWGFVVRALGDCGLPDARSWPELRTYLERCGDSGEMVEAARIIWGSYLAEVAKRRKRSAPGAAVRADPADVAAKSGGWLRCNA